MKIATRKEPWYAAGLAFECTGCGFCCAGPGEEYVWVTADEIAAIADFLHLPEPQVRERYIIDNR